ncbi:hypothetical protein RFI_32320 [Reticulomyxa filosa]|uniref:U6 snRNA phosphodiesterase 1 n=1 Tax=Reticulomyxa filosa TaxID=46433 RepID=X6LWH2_RETFI|nr:hypothetical protein RFI_32320 [Reticulomyxa filosa]|eukprot:ETO05075.1 hypothetical protein RFI_32320 [Reticulomyxa filosa]
MSSVKRNFTNFLAEDNEEKGLLNKNTEEKGTNNVPTKRRKKMALPSLSSVLNGIQEAETHKPKSDNTDHQGKIRSFGHKEGNWNVHVFLPIKINASNNFYPFLKSICNNNLSKSVDSQTIHFLLDEPMDDNLLHISVSRSQPIRTHQINTFIDTFIKFVVDVLQKQKILTTLQQIELSGLKIFSNDEKTRHFASILVREKDKLKIVEIIELVNQVMEKFQLQTYYQDAMPHLSFAWSIHPISLLLNTPSNKDCTNADLNSVFSVVVNAIHVQIGNQINLKHLLKNIVEISTHYFVTLAK